MTLSTVHLEAEDCGVASVSATASNRLLQEDSRSFGLEIVGGWRIDGLSKGDWWLE